MSEASLTDTFTVTADAATFIKDTLSDPKNGGKTALRVAIEGGGCSGFQYAFALADMPEADDHVIKVEGGAVVVDPMSMQYLGGAKLDFEDTLSFRGLKINNPNATARCGCGSSFSV